MLLSASKDIFWKSLLGYTCRMISASPDNLQRCTSLQWNIFDLATFAMKTICHVDMFSCTSLIFYQRIVQPTLNYNFTGTILN